MTDVTTTSDGFASSVVWQSNGLVVSIARFLPAKDIAMVQGTSSQCRRFLSGTILPKVLTDRSVVHPIESLHQLYCWERIRDAGLFQENRVGFRHVHKGRRTSGDGLVHWR